MMSSSTPQPPSVSPDKRRELLLYVFFGLLAFIVSMTTFWLFYQVLGINELIANVLSWICAVLFAFLTNRKWVFSSSESKGFLQQMVSFFAGRLATLGIEELILLVFITLLGLPGLPVKFFAQVVVTILNYLFSKLYVFK